MPSVVFAPSEVQYPEMERPSTRHGSRNGSSSGSGGGGENTANISPMKPTELANDSLKPVSVGLDVWTRPDSAKNRASLLATKGLRSQQLFPTLTEENHNESYDDDHFEPDEDDNNVNAYNNNTSQMNDFNAKLRRLVESKKKGQRDSKSRPDPIPMAQKDLFEADKTSIRSNMSNERTGSYISILENHSRSRHSKQLLADEAKSEQEDGIIRNAANNIFGAKNANGQNAHNESGSSSRTSKTYTKSATSNSSPLSTSSSSSAKSTSKKQSEELNVENHVSTNYENYQLPPSGASSIKLEHSLSHSSSRDDQKGKERTNEENPVPRPRILSTSSTNHSLQIATQPSKTSVSVRLNDDSSKEKHSPNSLTYRPQTPGNKLGKIQNEPLGFGSSSKRTFALTTNAYMLNRQPIQQASSSTETDFLRRRSHSFGPVRNQNQEDENMRDKAFKAWLRRKITEERTKKEKEKEQLEAERKRKEEKQALSEKNFKIWANEYDKKKTELRAKDKQRLANQSLKSKQEGDEKKSSAAKSFEYWVKSNAEKEQKIRERVQSAETIRKQELEAVKSTRDDDSRAAFDAWLKLKNEEHQIEAERNKNVEEFQRIEMESEKEHRQSVAKEAYDLWLKMKNEEDRFTQSLAYRILEFDADVQRRWPLPWKPVGNTVPQSPNSNQMIHGRRRTLEKKIYLPFSQSHGRKGSANTKTFSATNRTRNESPDWSKSRAKSCGRSPFQRGNSKLFGQNSSSVVSTPNKRVHFGRQLRNSPLEIKGDKM